jgi:hypothetical protein
VVIIRSFARSARLPWFDGLGEATGADAVCSGRIERENGEPKTRHASSAALAKTKG